MKVGYANKLYNKMLFHKRHLLFYHLTCISFMQICVGLTIFYNQIIDIKDFKGDLLCFCFIPPFHSVPYSSCWK